MKTPSSLSMWKILGMIKETCLFCQTERNSHNEGLHQGLVWQNLSVFKPYCPQKLLSYDDDLVDVGHRTFCTEVWK
jgi:hypothetical protein